MRRGGLLPDERALCRSHLAPKGPDTFRTCHDAGGTLADADDLARGADEDDGVTVTRGVRVLMVFRRSAEGIPSTLLSVSAGRSFMNDRQELFDFIRLQSMEHWRNSRESLADLPPEFIWARGDLVPIGMFGWADSHWTCLRRDGALINALGEDTADEDFHSRARNPAIGRLMQLIPAASAYLRPWERVVVCGVCEGTGRRREELCYCGGLGWVDCE